MTARGAAWFAAALINAGCDPIAPPLAPSPPVTCATSEECADLQQANLAEVRRCDQGGEPCADARRQTHEIALAFDRVNAREAKEANEAREHEGRAVEASARDHIETASRAREAGEPRSCDSDRAERRRWHMDLAAARASQREAQERAAEQAEASPEGQLRAYQLAHCERSVRTEEQAEARVVCDDGSGVAKICEIDNPVAVVEYLCPASAPAPIRGRHALVALPRSNDAPMAWTGSSSEMEHRMRARDRQCADADFRAIPLPQGADAGSLDAGFR